MKCLLLFCCSLLVGLGMPVKTFGAITSTWTAAGADNSFHNPDNWDVDVPGVDDRAVFLDGAGYAAVYRTMELQSSVTNYNIRMGQISALTTYTFDLGGHLYYLDSTASSWVTPGLYMHRCKLIVTNGVMSAGSIGLGEGNAGGTLIITGPNTVFHSRSSSGLANRIAVNNGGHQVTLRVEHGAQARFGALRLHHDPEIIVQGHGSVVTNTGIMEVRGTPTLNFFNRGHWRQEGELTKVAPDVNSIVMNFDGGSMKITHANGLNLSGAGLTEMNFTLYAGECSSQLIVEHDVDLGENTVFNLALDDGFTSQRGEVFTLIGVDGNLVGIFEKDGSPLNEGDILVLGDSPGYFFRGYKFRVSYAGGNGNDFTLTTVDVPSRGTFFLVR